MDTTPPKSSLERISPAGRAVVALHYLDGLTLDETAAVLELPAGTVKSRLAYGLATLRRVLAEDGIPRSVITRRASIRNVCSGRAYAMYILQTRTLIFPFDIVIFDSTSQFSRRAGGRRSR
ncbi:MAG TPA: sigma factor-like helix-turn-helix DNA-binding protein [Longimicrobiaceae bacterium]|nr:sigma factor-like helix-turn-helix DNA-binding protein [Longimicrobiaceae bacterium]